MRSAQSSGRNRGCGPHAAALAAKLHTESVERWALNKDQFENFETFKNEVVSLKGNGLLDKWNSFKDSPASKEPELGMLKTNCLEAALMREFGFSKWQKAADAREKKAD